ncbi:ABC transporter permease subunit [Paenibacillus sp. LMG 31456]|uniref:ABC transporter permease subunit n=1 Tax=Paenibacillus foliorum TaxID=2654974 RepID=A0A972GTM3_9BACL|nr:ABC transporter permease subunit [Paenibacillus foliorum]NOU94229.1 ABC transporter permease subunit [Paenibacillus foliorum]
MGERKKLIQQSKYLYLMLILPMLYFVIFKYGPLFGLLIAFKEYNVFQGIWRSEWAGIKYFQQFLSDPYFWTLVRNTVLMNIYLIVFFFPAPVLLALLLNEMKSKLFKKFVQTVSYLPHFLSTVVICGMIINFLTNEGLINRIIAGLGYEPIQFLMQPGWFRTIYVSSEIWQGVGWGAIIYLAALTSIDPQLYEAATMDGANRWKQMLHVTLPGIAPVITIMFLLNLGNIMSIGYEKILLLYTGPTYETADVISTFVYRRGLVGSDFSFATAVEFFQSILVLCFVVTANYIARKVSQTSLW